MGMKRLRETIELLEAIAADRTVLEDVPAEERRRLLQAVALVYSPDRVERRRMARTVARDRRARRVQQDEAARAGTGIRVLRQKPIFHTPNVFPPTNFEQHNTHTSELQHCYVCKEKYTEIHHFYDQMCPSCASVNFRKRTELADLR